MKSLAIHGNIDDFWRIRLENGAWQKMLMSPVAADGPQSDPALVGLMIAVAALDRRESRGGHFRTDWAEADPWQARSRALTLRDALRMAEYATARVPA